MAEKKFYKSNEEYIMDQPEKVRFALLELMAIILEAAPDAHEGINYAIPAFALVLGGKRDQQIMIAGFAKHVGLYPGPMTIEHFEADLAPYKFAKGSVQFPLDKPLPKDLILRMVAWRRNQLVK